MSSAAALAPAQASPPAPPRLQALFSAARRAGDAVLLLPPLGLRARADPTLPRLLRALAEAHAEDGRGQLLQGMDGAMLVLALRSGLRALVDAAEVLAPRLGSRIFSLPQDAAALVEAAGNWFDAKSSVAMLHAVAAPSAGPAAAAWAEPPGLPRREAMAILARGAAPRLAARRAGMPGAEETQDDPLLWIDLEPHGAPPPGFRGIAVAPAERLADSTHLQAWRAALNARGGRLAIGGIEGPLLDWLHLAAIPADLLLLRWSPALPAELAMALRHPGLAPRLVLMGTDTAAALGWGLRIGITIFAGAVVEALLAAARLGACPVGAGCTAAACAIRAAASDPKGRAGCANPALLARWLP